MRPASVNVLLCGDVMLGRGVDQIMTDPVDPRLHEPQVQSATEYVSLAETVSGAIPRRAPPAYVWGDALATWDALAPDVRIINLETAVTRSEAYDSKGINYRMSPAHVGSLRSARIDACSLANNHVLDWGRPGLIETLEVLKRAGVRCAGAGRSLAEAETPAILDAGPGARILLIACATGDSGIPWDWAAGPDRPGVNHIDLGPEAAQRIGRSLASIRRPGDLAVVSIHWGPNWGYAVEEEARSFAHALIDEAGVSVVHGHSSHHPKAAEVHNGRLVLYGCGDLINDYEGIGGLESYRPDLTAAYVAGLDTGSGALTDFRITPFRLKRFRLGRPSPEDADWLRLRLGREYGRFGLGVEPEESGCYRVDWRAP